jgi:hypothetical protein
MAGVRRKEFHIGMEMDRLYLDLLRGGFESDILFYLLLIPKGMLPLPISGVE